MCLKPKIAREDQKTSGPTKTFGPSHPAAEAPTKRLPVQLLIVSSMYCTEHTVTMNLNEFNSIQFIPSDRTQWAVHRLKRNAEHSLSSSVKMEQVLGEMNSTSMDQV